MVRVAYYCNNCEYESHKIDLNDFPMECSYCYSSNIILRKFVSIRPPICHYHCHGCQKKWRKGIVPQEKENRHDEYRSECNNILTETLPSCGKHVYRELRRQNRDFQRSMKWYENASCQTKKGWEGCECGINIFTQNELRKIAKMVLKEEEKRIYIKIAKKRRSRRRRTKKKRKSSTKRKSTKKENDVGGSLKRSKSREFQNKKMRKKKKKENSIIDVKITMKSKMENNNSNNGYSEDREQYYKITNDNLDIIDFCVSPEEVVTGSPISIKEKLKMDYEKELMEFEL